MKQFSSFVFIGLLFLVGITAVINNNQKSQELKALTAKIATLDGIRINDSIQLSEYRNALDTFFTVNFKAAQQYMSLVEQENIK